MVKRQAQYVKPLSALDYQLIKRAAAKWNHAVAIGDPDLFVDCFTDGGCLEMSDAWNADIFGGRHSGKSALRRYIDGVLLSLGAGSLRFWHSLPLIETEGDAAVLRAYCFAFVPSDNGVAWIGSGLHQDRLRKVKDDWRFEERRLEIEHFNHGGWVGRAVASLAQGGALTPTPEYWPRGISAGEPGQALDYELILQTQARYSFDWDFSEAESWARLYTESGTFRVVGLDHLYESASWHAHELPTIYTGRKELADFVRAAAVGKDVGRERHWKTLPFVWMKGDLATAYVPAMTRTAGAFSENCSMVTILYVDRLKKVAGEWLFEERLAVSERASGRSPAAIGESGIYASISA